MTLFKKFLLIISAVFILIGLATGGFMLHQHKEHEKMVAIATSDEAKKVYEEFIRQRDPEAFTDNGVIKTYEVDLTSLDYNPMGGLMVTILLNKRTDLYISYNLIDNGDQTYHSSYFVGSPNLLDVISQKEKEK